MSLEQFQQLPCTNIPTFPDSPPVMYSGQRMDNYKNSSSLSCLLCQETDSIFRENGIEDDEYGYLSHNPRFLPDNGEEYIELLLQKERNFGSFGYGSFESSGYCLTNSKPWMKCARLDAIEWIFNVCYPFPFLLCFSFSRISAKYGCVLSISFLWFRLEHTSDSKSTLLIFPWHTLIGFFRNDP